MWTPTVILLAITVLLACGQLGGGAYEVLVLDAVWPNRPAIIQPQHGGMSRRRFWIPAHAALEIALIAAVIANWGHPQIRTRLLVAVASHVVMRLWSFIDFVPKAVAFEKGNPATIERTAAVRWTRRSLLRLPLDAVTCIGVLAALIAAS